MTKTELIKFLEPFNDDIQIAIERYEDSYSAPDYLEFKPEYKIYKHDSMLSDSVLDLQQLDGFVALI